MERFEFSKYAFLLLSTQMALPSMAVQLPAPGAAFQTGADNFLTRCVDDQMEFIANPSSGFSSSNTPVVNPLTLATEGSEGEIRSLFNDDNRRREFESLYLTRNDHVELFVSRFDYSPGEMRAANPTMYSDVANITDATQFYAACGDRFVSAVVLGGEVQVVSRIEFANTYDAEKFDAKFPQDGRQNHINDDVIDELKFTGTDAALIVAVNMDDVSLVHFFDYLIDRGLTPATTKTCDTQTWSQCRELLDAATSYATSAAGGYASQFSDITAFPFAGSSILFNDYTAVAGADLNVLAAVAQLNLTANKATIESLVQKYETRVRQLKRIEVLLNVFAARLDEAKKSRLGSLSVQLKSEIQKISSVGINCLNGASDCAAQSDALALQDFNDVELEAPSTESTADDVSFEHHHGGGGSVGLAGLLVAFLSLIGVKRARRNRYVA